MSVAIAMVPEEQFGVVIHTTMHRTWLPQA
jgi:hypothetical protein